MANTVDLYDDVYGDYESAAEGAVRRVTDGEDIGQSSWMTSDEWLGFADKLRTGPASRVLEVGSGSGGPAVCLSAARGCRVTGVDINPHGISNAQRLAEARQVAARVAFATVDASAALPFPDGTFDAVVSNDAMCHIAHRLHVLRDWHRLLRPGGRIAAVPGLRRTAAVGAPLVPVRVSG